MLSRLWGGRRAEAFQDAVDGHVELSNNELSEFVDLAHTVREIPAVRLDSETRIAMRARLVAEAESVLTAAPTPVRYVKPRKHKTLRAAVGVTVVLGALSGGVVSVSASSLPGDMLYPVKLGVERFELTFNGDPAEAGRARFEHAATRLEEADQLARSGGTAGIAGALDGFSEEADAGADQLLRAFAADSDAASITAIRSFTHSSASQLASLAAEIDESKMPAYTEAVSTITAIDKRAVSTCPACTEEPPIDVPYNVEPEGGDNTYSLPPVMLPELDDRFFDDRQQELPDGVLTDPQLVPRDTDLPDRDDVVPPPDDSDDNDSDGWNPIRPDQGTDHESSPRDHSRPDGDKDGNVLPDLPDLPTDKGSSKNDLPAPKLDQVPEAIDGLLKKLGPLGTLDDLLGPLLGDNDDKPGTKKDDGPISQLLGPLLGDDDNGKNGNKNEDDEGTLEGLLGQDDEQDGESNPDDGSDNQQDPDVLEPDNGSTDQEGSELPDVIEPEKNQTDKDGSALDDKLDGLEGEDEGSSELNDDGLSGGTQ